MFAKNLLTIHFCRKNPFMFFYHQILPIMKGTYNKRKSTVINANLSAVKFPPPKGYYLFLLSDSLGCDASVHSHHINGIPSLFGRFNFSNSTIVLQFVANNKTTPTKFR